MPARVRVQAASERDLRATCHANLGKLDLAVGPDVRIRTDLTWEHGLSIWVSGVRSQELQLAARAFEYLFEGSGGLVYVRGDPVVWDILSSMGTRHDCRVVAVFELHSPDSLDALFDGLVRDVSEVQIFVSACPASQVRVRRPPFVYNVGVYAPLVSPRHVQNNSLLEEPPPPTLPGCVELARELMRGLGATKSSIECALGNTRCPG